MMVLYYLFFTGIVTLAFVVWVRILYLSSKISDMPFVEKDVERNYRSVESFLLFSNPGFPVLALAKLLPGTFVGLGILGTFLGFSDGITKLDLSRQDPTEFLNHLDVFFSGLKTAFGTSIAGVILSVLFGTILYQWPLNKIKYHCARLYNDSNEGINFAEGTKTEFDSFLHSIQEMTKTLLTAKESIETLPDKFLAVGKSLEQSIGPVKETFGAMQSTLANYAKQAVALQNASEQIQSSLTKFIETSGETTGKVNEVLAQTIKATKDIQANNVKLNSDHKVMLEDYRELHETLNTAQTKIKDEVASYGKEIKTHFSKLLASYAEQSREIIQNQNMQLLEERKAVMEDYKQIDKNISAILSSVNQNISEYSEVIEKTLVQTLEEYNNTAKKVTESFFGGQR